jgi:uncharacterized membrane protein
VFSSSHAKSDTLVLIASVFLPVDSWSQSSEIQTAVQMIQCTVIVHYIQWCGNISFVSVTGALAPEMGELMQQCAQLVELLPKRSFTLPSSSIRCLSFILHLQQSQIKHLGTYRTMLLILLTLFLGALNVLIWKFIIKKFLLVNVLFYVIKRRLGHVVA